MGGMDAGDNKERFISALVAICQLFPAILLFWNLDRSSEGRVPHQERDVLPLLWRFLHLRIW